MLIGIISIVPKLGTHGNLDFLDFSNSKDSNFDYRYELPSQKIAILSTFCMLLACKRAEDNDKFASNADLSDIVADVEFVTIKIESAESGLGVVFEYSSSSQNIDNILSIVCGYEKYCERIFFKEHVSIENYFTKVKKNLRKFFKWI